MYRSKRIYLMLLPLALLLCLTCPVKQEIKQSLNIPIDTHISFEKKNDFRSCITVTRNNLFQKTQKQITEKDLLYSSFVFAEYIDNAPIYPQQNNFLNGNSTSVPLFIFHRKLII